MPMQTEVMYRYELGCGHVYASTTRSLCADCDSWREDESVPDQDELFHWFLCAQCEHGNVHVLTHQEAVEAELIPRRVNGRRCGDIEVADAVDTAIVHWRVVKMLKLYQGSVPAGHIAVLCGVTVRTVFRIIKLDPALTASDMSDI